MKPLHMALVLLSAACGCVSEPEPKELIRAGMTLPEFTVVTSAGDTVSTSMLAGSVSVITFFNTGCDDCRRELPRLQEAMERNPSVRFLCIAREEADSSIAAYWRANCLTLPYAPQTDRKVYSLFATEGIPRTYVSGADLRVTATY